MITTSKISSLKQHLIRSVLGTFGLKVIATGFAFLLNMLLAKLLGSGGIGIYALCVAWLGILGLPATLGFPQLLIRDAAVYSSNNKIEALKGLILRAYQISIILSIIFTIIGMLCTYFLIHDSEVYSTFLIALLALPFNSIRNLNRSTMTGLNRVVKGQLPDTLFFPMFMVASLFTTSLILTKDISPRLVFVLYFFITVSTFLVGSYQVVKNLPDFFLDLNLTMKHGDGFESQFHLC